MGHSQHRAGVDDGWPWDCTRCGATIYHDADNCRDCDRADRAGALAGRSDGSRLAPTFGAWMERQTYPSFVGRVIVVAAVELLLTTAWLQVLFSRGVLGSIPA